LGDLNRLQPVSPVFGFERGNPIDRFYIEKFLSEHNLQIRGRVLEVGDNAYTRRFGGKRVSACDVLNVREGVQGTTIVADLADGAALPSDAFDCLIITQTLHLIYDFTSAVQTLHRMLKPGGTLLLTSPGTISQLGPGEWGGHWFWGFTPLALRTLFGAVFGEQLSVTSYGNVLASIAFLEGMATEEFAVDILEYSDPRYPLVLAVHAVK
jgi:SAM-dependent methyltransferase